ncbi:MAG: purine-nucleoside phosphorylase [Oscillospiraceae bacterium]|nr:purine-nucleoside phosphorylase [Oscillospiraceae bacterium]
MELTAKITAAAEYLKAHVDLRPTIGLVLGSGLGDYADTLEDRICIPFADIPNFPLPTIEGHTGALVFGRKQGKTVVMLQGRIHYYEGLSMREITLPIRVLAALGVKQLVLTNAAGGVNTAFHPGDLMLIADHINYSGMNPLIGPNLDAFGPRFPDMSDLYTADLRAAIREAAKEAGIPLQEGVYAMYSGPNYETPAEIRMFRVLGADAVGMSTVPEALVAGHCGMQVVGVSCVTNMAAGVLPLKLDHSDVMESAARVHDTFQNLMDVIIKTL